MSTLDNALQALLNMAHKEVIWTNASPASSLSAQDITLGLNDVSGIEILWSVSTSSNEIFNTGFIPTGSRYRLEDTFYENGEYTVYRWGAVSNTAVGISNGTRNGEVNNKYAIILAIYAVKGVEKW